MKSQCYVKSCLWINYLRNIPLQRYPALHLFPWIHGNGTARIKQCNPVNFQWRNIEAQRNKTTRLNCAFSSNGSSRLRVFTSGPDLSTTGAYVLGRQIMSSSPRMLLNKLLFRLVSYLLKFPLLVSPFEWSVYLLDLNTWMFFKGVTKIHFRLL